MEDRNCRSISFIDWKSYSARPEFVSGEIYHIYNRGVEGRSIVQNKSDCYRFIHDLYEFNDEDAAADSRNCIKRGSSSGIIATKKRKLLVEILMFCLMPNHFHLLVRQLAERGISKFMQKMGTGYTNYFNKKYERKGVLFQGKFKAKLVIKDTHFDWLPYYIHMNPLDLKGIEWREGKVGDPKAALDFLQFYRWSSYHDYIGKRNFPSVTQRGLLLDYLVGPEAYSKSVHEWLTGKLC